MVYRIYVEKKPQFAVDGGAVLADLNVALGIKTVENVRIINRYDCEKLPKENFEAAVPTVFSEPPVDEVYYELPKPAADERMFAVEFLPGQFDQRADSAAQCIQMLCPGERPVVKYAKIYVLKGKISDDEFARIKHYLINAVESRECGFDKYDTLEVKYTIPTSVETLTGFINKTDAELADFVIHYGLAMDNDDIKFCQDYFKSEHRDPTITEIRMIDTYWSDHCRHTTFGTIIDNADIKPSYIADTYAEYKADRHELGRDNKPLCLMDIATLAAKKLKKDGILKDLDESEEINACSVRIKVDVDGRDEDWLLMFKNETHNHPTEIEPFGGAATCLGGAIRDPLSGRTYVYQAMRVTGAADPTKPLNETLHGKLPQRKIVTGAASGYSSYGNQIGLATGYVKEIYHPNYAAKRMEIGAVMAAAPRKNVIRETSDPGDLIILLGGRTGRDGCGGATGSSKVHTEASIETCGAEVQKGNAPTERKLQRLFRRPEVSKLIRKCNDFGAGGVSVAIGELAAGLEIDLDKVPKKYAGLDGTEIAISESQERMAVVVDPKDVDEFMAYAKEENLEATVVAVVTEDPRLVLVWRGKEIVNLSRAFLDTNGAHQETDVEVEMPSRKDSLFIKKEVEDVKETWLNTLSDLNVCSQKGLVEMFDGSIGAGSVFMPHGGKYQMTETQAMVAKVPVQNGTTDSVSMMSYGFDPYLSSWSPYHGAVYAVTESVAKIVAAGGDYSKIRFTFQEYFRRMTEDPKRWSQPFAALLGAYAAQIGFGLPSIGGKDSMSGTFQDIDVPPTLVSFAVDMALEQDIITPELKKAGNKLVWLKIERDENDLPVYEKVMEQYGKIHEDIQKGRIVSAYALDRHGIASAVSKMAFGNGLGVQLETTVDKKDLFAPVFGDLIAEVPAGEVENLVAGYTEIGAVTEEAVLAYGDVTISLKEAEQAWTGTLEKVFATKSAADSDKKVEEKLFNTADIHICSHKIGQPTVFIPVFPGTNCEYDSKRAFERAGAKVITKVFRNLDAEDIRGSVGEFEKAIGQAQMIMFPGGFSAGDEPDGSAKFFATAFQNAKIKEAVEKLLNEQGKGYGIHNIKERLELYYGALGSLEVKVTDAKYTCFTVKMPDTLQKKNPK